MRPEAYHVTDLHLCATGSASSVQMAALALFLEQQLGLAPGWLASSSRCMVSPTTAAILELMLQLGCIRTAGLTEHPACRYS